MRTLEFTKRNIKEIFRDPLCWVFLVSLPVVLFIVLQLIMNGIGVDLSNTPQFEINHFTIAMIIFSFSFLTIFVGINLAKDREEKFLLRLKSTPMKAYDFVLGYTLAMFPFAFAQEIMVIIIGFIFGLKFSVSLLLVILCLLPISFLFIGFGILFGCCFSSKGVGGVSSIIPQASSLLGGIFFPLSLITGGFKIVCYSLPFANAIDIGLAVYGVAVENIVLSIIVCIAYTILVYGISIVIFCIKLKKDSI